ncbi:glycosyltransferase family 32 protein [Basilea psittacipulmonis]|uniref:Glycosyl transferase n=1 Tax=Basilea psittacipulmonis DSM 24701 TaxID=1072685 RepID=A0A077DFL0_9BURK|nr:glycosyltransferase [Basilea psittacipulmonis]AIL31953.1 glycosyl transferase [Basilea psittacipulmonis DSM 24701]
MKFYKPVKHEKLILASRAITRFIGHIVKYLCYIFHFLFPKKRFTIPFYSPAKIKKTQDQKIPRIIWQTNYTNKVSLPVYCNYLVNRFFSQDYEYRYMGHEEREKYIKEKADEVTFKAFDQIADGAAQADFWRLFVLYTEGGVYLDIDAQLAWNLSAIIGEEDKEVFITRRDHYNNFFMASAPGNPLLKDVLDRIILNIQDKENNKKMGVYGLTGPTVLNAVLNPKEEAITVRRDSLTCSQGTFTNEHFQYIDKKRSKWTYKSPDEIFKKD